MSIDRLAQEIRHGTLALSLIAAFAIPSIDAQGGGTIVGTVTTAAAAPRALRVTIDQRVCGQELPDESIVTDGQGGLANAVVTLAGVRSRDGAGRGAVMNDTCRFAPRVQIVNPRATITTSSRDPILHTTSAQTENGRTLFNVAIPVPGLTISRPVADRGIVRLSCNTHPWMRGWMVVTDEMAAVTAGDGSFRLANVPAGTHTIRLWHESLGSPAQQITVKPGETATVAFSAR